MSASKIVLPLALVLALAACKTPQERAEAFLQSGIELVAEGDLDRAAVEFRNALQADETLYEARRELGKIFLSYNNTSGAFRHYIRVIEHQPVA